MLGISLRGPGETGSSKLGCPLSDQGCCVNLGDNMLLKNSSLYFDSNFFYDCFSGEISEVDLAKLDTCVAANNIRCFYSVISFIEIASHINEREKSDFSKFQALIRCIRSICNDNILPYPEMSLATILGTDLPPVEDVNGFNNLIKLISQAPDYDTLVQGQYVEWDKGLAYVTYNEDKLAKFRERYESLYVREMYINVIDIVNPGYYKRLAKDKPPRVTNKEELKKINAYLDSSVFKRIFLDVCYCKVARVGIGSLVGVVGEVLANEKIDKISAYFEGYKSIIRKNVNDGYSIEKNKNDYNDLHYLIYLGLSDNICFITGEKNLRKKIVNSPQ